MTAHIIGRAPCVLGFDLALTLSGVCAYKPADATGPMVASIAATGDWYRRVKVILRDVATLVDAWHPDLVVIEKLPSHRGRMSGDDLVDMAGMHAVVRYYLTPRVPIMYVQNTHLKIYGCGSAASSGEHKVTKSKVALAVQRRYGQQVPEFRDDNQVDAFLLVATALDHYGHPLASVPQTHARALEMIREPWPNLPHLTDCTTGAVIPGAPPANSGAGRAPTPGGTR